MNGTVTDWLSPVVNWPSRVNSGRNGTVQSALRYTVLTRTSFWSWTTLSVTIVGMSPRVLCDTHPLMVSAAAAPSAVSIGWSAAPYWAAAVWRNSGSSENPWSGNRRLATSRVVGPAEASASRRSTALAASWTPASGNPKMSSSVTPVSADAPARLRLKAVPMLTGLETALPVRSRWKSHPAALMPTTHSPAGASGSAGSRSATGSSNVVVVSEEPQAAATAHSTTKNPSNLVTAIGRYSSSHGSPGGR